MGYRQKIVISQVVLFGFFIILSLPFIERAVVKVQLYSLNQFALQISDNLKKSPSEQEMILSVQNLKADIFTNVALFDNKIKLLASSKKGGDHFDNDLLLYNTSIEAAANALRDHELSGVTDTIVFNRQYVITTTLFEFQGKEYVFQGVFPYLPLEKFRYSFNIWFGSVCFVAFIIFAISTWAIFSRLHKPIQQIITAIKAYQSGDKILMVDILKNSDFSKDQDFGRLAHTITMLNSQVQSQLEELTSAKNEKEAILESLIEGVIAVDSDQIVTYVNFVGEKMLGMTKRELIGLIFPEFRIGQNEELFKKSTRLLDFARKNKKLAIDSIEIDNGKRIHLDMVAAPISNSKGAILVLQDNSSQYKIVEMGKDFVANASHELRTPITIIKGFAETLQDMKEMPAETLSSVVDKIVRNCERMECLIKNLLTLADIENLSISPFLKCDMISLIENCIQIVQAVYTDAIITFQKDESILMVAADGNLFELAIINLLTNAAKYSKPPAKIHVSILQKEEMAEIVIKDQGIGIPPADIGRIFERFYTVDKAHSRKMGGAGLGLSLVKTIIDKHHGTIKVDSKIGEGTSFTIVVPIAKRP